MMTKSRGTLIIWSGPSGSGKGTVLKEAVKKDENLRISVSATTRKPREGDIDGIHYHFITREEFEKRIEAGEFLEYAQYVGNYYGTLERAVDDMLSEGYDVILEIEVVGAMKVKEKRPDCLMVFVAPPSIEELKRRLSGRGTESEEEVMRRINEAERELKCAEAYDYVIVNDEVSRAADELISIINEHKKTV